MERVMGRRERKKLESKKKIMDAAVKNFKKKGVAETSIANIMKTAGLGVGTFYNYFESREELLLSLLRNLAEEVRMSAEEKMQTSLPAQDILRSAMARTTKMIEQNAYVLPLLFSTIGTPQRLRSDFGAKPLRSPGFKSIFTKIIAYGQERGEFDAALDPDLVTEMFHSIFQAASFSRLSYSFDENVDRKIGLILYGVVPGKGKGG